MAERMDRRRSISRHLEMQRGRGVAILGGVGLFLLGTTVMTEGLKALTGGACGPRPWQSFDIDVRSSCDLHQIALIFFELRYWVHSLRGLYWDGMTITCGF